MSPANSQVSFTLGGALSSTARRSGTSRRVSLLDRAWLPIWGGSFLSPLVLPDVDLLRRCVLTFLEQHPTDLLASRLDRATMRWVPVPAAQRMAHVNRLIVATSDPPVGEEIAHFQQHAPERDRDEPFKVVLGRESLTVYTSHVVGDSHTWRRFLLALVTADPDGLAQLDDRADGYLAARALAARCARHPADLARFARNGLRELIGPRRLDSGSAARPSAPVTVTDGAEDGRPLYVAVSYDLAIRDEVRRWRDTHLPGVTTTAIFASVIHGALVDAGVNLRRDGLHVLIDARRNLPMRSRGLAGNLAKGVDLKADMADPRAISTAVSHAVQTGAAIPAMAANMLQSLRQSVSRRETVASSATAGEPLLNFNFSWHHTDANTRSLPYIENRPKCRVGGGCFVGPTEFNLIGNPVGGNLQVVASFNERTVDRDRVRDGLERLGHVAELLNNLPIT